MAMSKKVLTVFLLIAIVGLAVYFLFFRNTQNPDSKESSDPDLTEREKTSDAAIPVRVADVIRGDLVIKLRSPGEAVTHLKIDIKAEIPGKIKNIYVEESQHVKKGDLLLELDDREYRLDLESNDADRLRKLSELLLEQRFGQDEPSDENNSNSRIRALTEEYKKLSTLYQKGQISRDEYEKKTKKIEWELIASGQKKDEVIAAVKGLTQAEIMVKKSRLTLEKTKIRAPFSGIITNIQVSPQENIASGRDLFTLVNINRIQVHAKVLESEIGKIKVGREVDLRFAAYPQRIIKGRVVAISPLVNPEDKTCKAIIDVENPNEMIKPGMHSDVEIAAEIHKDRLLVPQDAILTRSGRKLVFVVEDGLAKWKYIKTGLENREFVEILEGEEPGGVIQEGMKVLVEGHFTIAHDARVKIVN